jgi:hypothetical protein
LNLSPMLGVCGLCQLFVKLVMVTTRKICY